jgi:hypothetical protein
MMITTIMLIDPPPPGGGGYSKRVRHLDFKTLIFNPRRAGGWAHTTLDLKTLFIYLFI